LGSFVDITPNSKKFGLSGSDVDCIMKSFDNGIIIDVDMGNQSGYLIFNTHV